MRQTPGEFDHDLSRAGADIECAAVLPASNEPESVLDESIVYFFEVGLRRGGCVGFHFARIVHHLWLRDSR